MSNRKDDNITIVESSGDVFSDLGIQLDERDRIKNAIAHAICARIEARELTQKDAAAILKTDQAKVSNIARGRLNGFSVERLLGYLAALGFDVDIHLKPTRADRGRVTVYSDKVAATG